MFTHIRKERRLTQSTRVGQQSARLQPPVGGGGGQMTQIDRSRGRTTLSSRSQSPSRASVQSAASRVAPPRKHASSANAPSSGCMHTRSSAYALDQAGQPHPWQLTG